MQKAFKIQQEVKANLGLKRIAVKVNDKYKPIGPRQYARAVKKYSFEPTLPGPCKGLCALGLAKKAGKAGQDVSALDAAGSPRKGKEPAEDQEDLLYLAEVEIGTPPQKLMLDFDTGSADLWVFSTDLDASAQSGHNVFDPSASSTFKAAGDLSWEISYGDGSTASGSVGTDTISIGGLPIKAQAIELASTLSRQFEQSPGDGLLGLAWGSINTVTDSSGRAPVKTPVENMIAEKTLPKDAQLFTSCFYSTVDGDKESFFTFGYIEESLVTASKKEIAWTKVDNSQGFWMMPSETVTINGKKVARSGNTAIADTGTTLALVEDSVVSALYDAIPGSKYDQYQGGYMIPTTTTLETLPELSITLGDTDFVIQKENIVFGEPQDGFWFGGIQSRGNLTFDILGDVFLKSIYAIWDQGNVRFGAVPKIEAKQHLGNSGTKGGSTGNTGSN